MPCFPRELRVQRSSWLYSNSHSTSSTPRFTFRFRRSVLPLQYRAFRRGRRRYREDRADSTQTPKFSDVHGARRKCFQTYDATKQFCTTIPDARTDSSQSSGKSLSKSISENNSSLQSGLCSRPQFDFNRSSSLQNNIIGDGFSPTDAIGWAQSAPQLTMVDCPSDHLASTVITVSGNFSKTNSTVPIISSSSTSLSLLANIGKQSQDKSKRVPPQQSSLVRSATFPLVSSYKDKMRVFDTPYTSPSSLLRRSMLRETIVLEKVPHPKMSYKNNASGDLLVSQSLPENDSSPVGPASPCLADDYDEKVLFACKENHPYICGRRTPRKASDELKLNDEISGTSENREGPTGLFVSVERKRNLVANSYSHSVSTLQEVLGPDSIATSNTFCCKDCNCETISRALSFSNIKLGSDSFQEQLTNKTFVNSGDNYPIVMKEAHASV